MSFLQLVSPNDSPSNFNVQFSEVIKINKNSKIALINLTGQSTFSVNINEVMKDFPNGMNTNFKIGDGANSILLNVDIFTTDFDNYDKTNITIQNLLEVLETKLNDVMVDYCAIGDPTDKNKRIAKYRINFETGLIEDGNIGVLLNGKIKDDDVLDKYDYFVPDWDATYSNNMIVDGTVEAPESNASTSSSSPAYSSIDNENGLGVNGNYMHFFVNTNEENFSVALSISGLDLTKEYFEIDDTDKDEIYAPVVLRFIKKSADSEYGTLMIVKHDGEKAYSTTPEPEHNILRFSEDIVSDTTHIEIWINNDASIIVRYTTGALSQDIPIDGLDEQYLFSSTNLVTSTIVPVLYTTTPNIQPIFNFRYTNSYNVKQETDARVYFRWNDLQEDKLFMPIYWAPNDFHNFLGFYKDNVVTFNPRDNGSFNVSSDRQIASNINGIDKLNIHITNLPIRSYKNKQNEKFNGFTTTLIRDVQYDGIGNINYDPPHIIYADLHNLNENINNLNIQIRDAYDNKITTKLIGSTILTLHLIN